jgi:hypothetical protein
LGAAAGVFVSVWMGTGFLLIEGDYSFVLFTLVFAGGAFYIGFIKSDVRCTIRSDENTD